MNRRDRQHEKSKLDKISETSSPSPTREEKPKDTAQTRVNPLTLTTALSSPRNSPSIRHDNRQQQLALLQEEIMDRKRRLDLWEEAQNKRTGKKSLDELLGPLCRGIAHLCKDRESKKSLLQGVRKGKKGILRWVLNWMKHLFHLIRMTLVKHRNFLS